VSLKGLFSVHTFVGGSRQMLLVSLPFLMGTVILLDYSPKIIIPSNLNYLLKGPRIQFSL
jgi:hypothetical protein